MQRSHRKGKPVAQVKLACFVLVTFLLPCCHPSMAKTTPTKPKTMQLKQLSAQMDKNPSAKEAIKSSTNAKGNASSQRAKELLEAGAKLHRSGHRDQAEQLFKQAIAVDPCNAADGFFNLGAIAEGRGDIVAALGHYRAGLAMRSDDKELKEAVVAMETKLSSSPDAFVHPPRAFTAPIGSPEIPVLSVETPEFTPQDAYLPPYQSAPVAQQNGAPFQLHSSMNTGFTPHVNPPLLPQAGQFGQNPPKQAGASAGAAVMRAVLRVGANAALGGGLHCPRCHIFGIPLGF